MADEHDDNKIEIALLKQRVELMEKDVRDLDTDIKSLRTELNAGIKQLTELIGGLKEDINEAKFFGKGVYWIAGLVVGGLALFKDQIIGLFK